MRPLKDVIEVATKVVGSANVVVKHGLTSVTENTTFLGATPAYFVSLA